MMLQVVVQVPPPDVQVPPPLPPEIVSIPPWAMLSPGQMTAIALAAIIVAGFILYPLVRALARRLEGGRADGARLQAELQDLRGRVGELEGARNELEERLDFTERLLAQAREPDRLGQGELH
jgi:hypothetical protein